MSRPGHLAEQHEDVTQAKGKVIAANATAKWNASEQ